MHIIEFDGKRFVKDKKHGYYHTHYGKTTKLLHRVVWESYNGKIPKGFHIHHKDGNKDNNDISNLEMISAREHLSNHGKKNFNSKKDFFLSHLNKIQELAKDWHSSDEGREWHSAHAKAVFESMPYVKKNCLVCGKEYEVKKVVQNRSKFCSNNCKSKFRRDSGIDNIKVVCPVCGKTFSKNKYSKQITCSKECSNENKKNK